jgi:hypothetical protein
MAQLLLVAGHSWGNNAGSSASHLMPYGLCGGGGGGGGGKDVFTGVPSTGLISPDGPLWEGGCDGGLSWMGCMVGYANVLECMLGCDACRFGGL